MVDTTSLLTGLNGTDGYSVIANYLGISVIAVVVIFLIIAIWSLIWKGIALWKAAHKEHKIWFIIFLIANTIGILEILYIFIFSKMGKKKESPPVIKRRR